MAVLRTKSTRLGQPQGPVQIDLSNPLARGGGIAVAPFSRDLLAAGTNARIHVGPQGFELGVNALVAGPAFSLSSPNAAGTSGADGFTQLIVFRRFGGATSTPSVFIEETAGGYFRNAFYYNGSSWVWRTRDTATGDTGAARDLTLTTPVAGAVEVRAFVVKPGAKRAFRNGRLDNSTATAAAFTATDSSAFQFAHSVSGGSSYSGDSRIALHVSINRALSDSEVAALSANPWQLLKPIERRIWVPVSAGGGGGVTALAALSGLGLAAAGASAAGGAQAETALAELALVPAQAGASGSAAGAAAMASVSLLPATATASGGSSVAGNASGGLAGLLLSAAAAAAAGVGVAAGTLRAVSLTPAQAVASGGATVPGNASAALAGLSTAPALASATGAATAAGPLLGMNLTPAQAQATAAAWASAELRALSLVPATGTANDGTGPDIDWPAGLRIDAPFHGIAAIAPDADARADVPFLGITAIVPYPGDEMKIIKTFEHYAPDRQTYRLDFDAKYLAGVGDTADKLVAFQADTGITATPQVSVGSALPSGVVRFAVESPIGTGPFKVAMQISTVGGDRRTGIVEFTVDPAAIFAT